MTDRAPAGAVTGADGISRAGAVSAPDYLPTTTTSGAARSPTTAHAAMESLGLVDDHLAGCHVRDACEADRRVLRSGAA